VILGEENPEQLAARAKRLKLSAKRTFLICDIDVENIGQNVAMCSAVKCSGAE
jgi:predicted ATP-dependent serine protease